MYHFTGNKITGPGLTGYLNKWIFSLTLLLAGLMPEAQQCDDFTQMVSAYYSSSPGYAKAAGVETGYIGNASRWGYYAGVQYEWPAMSGSGKLQANAVNAGLFIYAKGSCRMVRIEDRLSLFMVASGGIRMGSSFDLRSGVQAIIPLNYRLGLGAESLYHLRGNQASASLKLFYLLN